MFAPATPTNPEGDTICSTPRPTPGSPGGRAVPETGRALSPGPNPEPTVPGYEILGELGRGTMGVVYKARHLRLNRLVALKVVLAGPHARPEDLVRFLGEAEVLARCHHPHVVLVYESGWHDGRPYLAMEFVEGGTLAQQCAGVPQPPRWTAGLVESLAWAVEHAHRRGIIHRDLKPSNVMLSEGDRAKLTDFGLAKRLDAGAGLTETGALLGSPWYMAPEQALGEVVGPAADVYGLGTILYEMLTGRPPFAGEGVLRTLARAASEPPCAPRRIRPSVPRDLEAICLKCLEKNPERRYASAGELAADLRGFLAGGSVLAVPPRAWRRVAPWLGRHRGVAGCCVGAVFGAAATLAGGSVAGLVVLGALGLLGFLGWWRGRGRSGNL